MRDLAKIAALIFGAATATAALQAADRIDRTVDPNRTTVIMGQVHPLARAANDRGLADPGTDLSYVTLMLRPDASLETFLVQQRTPSSPNYRHWLTPEDFADRFGLSQNDIGKITARL